MQATCSCSMALPYLKSKENSQQEGTGDEWEMGNSMASKFPCMSLHLRQRGPGAGALSCHGEHSGDAQAHPGRGSIHVDPEGDPGQDDDE